MSVEPLHSPAADTSVVKSMYETATGSPGYTDGHSQESSFHVNDAHGGPSIAWLQPGQWPSLQTLLLDH